MVANEYDRVKENYDLKFKQSVIKYAEENSNREAGKKFSIDTSMVRRWRKKSPEISDKSSSQSKKRGLSGGGRKPFPGNQAFFLIIPPRLQFTLPKNKCGFYSRAAFNYFLKGIRAASVQGRLLFKGNVYSRKCGI